METLIKLCYVGFVFFFIREKMMQVQIVVLLKYRRCSFSGSLAVRTHVSDISLCCLFGGSKIPCQSTC